MQEERTGSIIEWENWKNEKKLKRKELKKKKPEQKEFLLEMKGIEGFVIDELS